MHTRFGGVVTCIVILTFLSSTLACSFSLTGLSPTQAGGSPAAPAGKTTTTVTTGKCVMPDLTGKNGSAVLDLRADFQVKIDSLAATSASMPKGLVIFQDLPTGTVLATCKENVTLTISTGPEEAAPSATTEPSDTPVLTQPPTATIRPTATLPIATKAPPTLTPLPTQAGPATNLSGGLGP